MRLPNDVDTRNKLILAIKRLIVAKFSSSKWAELAYLTRDGDNIVNGHGRLLRSLRFGDDDYEENVVEVIRLLIDENPENLDIMLDYTGFHDWIKQESAKDYATFFGYTYTLLQQTAIAAVSTSAEVDQHIARIQNSIDSDPALAVGSIKELIESILKTILEASGESVGKEDLSALLKRVQRLLNLDPSGVDAGSKGADTIKRVLSSLNQIVQGIDDLRNHYGTGHGRKQSPSITARHARLVVGSGASLAMFLMETFENRVQSGKLSPSKT